MAQISVYYFVYKNYTYFKFNTNAIRGENNEERNTS